MDASARPVDAATSARTIERVVDNVARVVHARPETLQLVVLCLVSEGHLIIEDFPGVSYPLGRPFMVAATQNPIEYEGTYPLPEAQLDRFTMRLALGYPPLADEARMLAQQTFDPPQDSLAPVSTAADVLAAAEDAKA